MSLECSHRIMHMYAHAIKMDRRLDGICSAPSELSLIITRDVRVMRMCAAGFAIRLSRPDCVVSWCGYWYRASRACATVEKVVLLA